MGNSEVGHLNLGAGAVVVQDLTRIDDAVAAGELAAQRGAARAVRLSAERRVHLIGLVSDGGVHSGLAAPGGADRAGRRSSAFPTWSSTPSPTAATRCRTRAPGSWRPSRTGAPPPGNARVGSVVGRYYAMDRDSRWDRTQLAYDLLVHGRGRAPGGRRAPRRSAPPTSAARPTSSSRRPLVGERGAHPPGRRRRPRLQLPARPHAPDHPRAGRAGVRRDRPGRRAAGGALRHDGRVRGGLAVSGRLPAGAARGDAGERPRRARACRSCTSPRPRSTPTSRTSSTAARRRPTRARSAS